MVAGAGRRVEGVVVGELRRDLFPLPFRGEGWGEGKALSYRGQDGFKVMHDVCVGEADYVPALLFQINGAFGVILSGRAMRVAINLNYKHRSPTGEVGDERSDHGLAAELDAG